MPLETSRRVARVLAKKQNCSARSWFVVFTARTRLSLSSFFIQVRTMRCNCSGTPRRVVSCLCAPPAVREKRLDKGRRRLSCAQLCRALWAWLGLQELLLQCTPRSGNPLINSVGSQPANAAWDIWYTRETSKQFVLMLAFGAVGRILDLYNY